MKMVYEASTGLEAHMIKNLLEQEDIDARIDGEYLQGGIGELQPIGIVRVMVEDEDYDRAMTIVTRWESEQSSSTPEKTKSRISTGGGFALGVILTVILSYLFFITPVSDAGIDYDDDGFLEEKWTYRGGLISETHIDRNYDANYDYIIYYDRKGLINNSIADDNFDGFFEAKTYYFQGNAVKQETDADQNGITDLITNYTFGVLDNIEFIEEKSGRIIKKQYFKLGKMVSADYDSNGDGKFDLHYEYDRYEISR